MKVGDYVEVEFVMAAKVGDSKFCVTAFAGGEVEHISDDIDYPGIDIDIDYVSFIRPEGWDLYNKDDGVNNVDKFRRDVILNECPLEAARREIIEKLCRGNEK